MSWLSTRRTPQLILIESSNFLLCRTQRIELLANYVFELNFRQILAILTSKVTKLVAVSTLDILLVLFKKVLVVIPHLETPVVIVALHLAL